MKAGKHKSAKGMRRTADRFKSSERLFRDQRLNGKCSHCGKD